MSAKGRYRYNQQASSNLGLGQNGFDEITGTEAGDWVAIKAIGGDATLSATSSIGDDVSSFTLDKGDVIYGVFSDIAVTAGTVLAYRG